MAPKVVAQLSPYLLNVTLSLLKLELCVLANQAALFAFNLTDDFFLSFLSLSPADDAPTVVTLASSTVFSFTARWPSFSPFASSATLPKCLDTWRRSLERGTAQ